MASGSHTSSRGTFERAHPQAAPLRARTEVSHFLQVAALLPGERCNGSVQASPDDPLKEKKKKKKHPQTFAPATLLCHRFQEADPISPKLHTYCLTECSSPKAEVTSGGKCFEYSFSHFLSAKLSRRSRQM